MAEDSLVDSLKTETINFVKTKEAKISAAGLVGLMIGISLLFNYQVGAVDTEASGGGGGNTDISSYIESSTTETGTEHLAEGSTFTQDFPFQNGSVLKSVNITIAWTDEPDIQRIRTYENQPDAFTVKAVAPEGKKKTASGENEHGKEGKITFSFDYTDAEISSQVNASKSGSTNLTLKLDVTLDSAGMFAPSIGLIGYTDEGNDFTYTIQFTWLSPPAKA